MSIFRVFNLFLGVFTRFSPTEVEITHCFDLFQWPEVNFFIDPCAHDGGTSIGGARYVWHNVFKNKQRYPLKSLFLG